MVAARPPPTEDQIKQALELKEQGNAAYKEKNYGTALRFYTDSLNLNPTREIYSNRCVVFTALNQHHQALNDAIRATETDPKWIRGWRRKANCLANLKRDAEAFALYKQLIKDLDNYGLNDEEKAKEKAEMRAASRKLEKSLKGEPIGLGRIAPVEEFNELPSVKVFNKAYAMQNPDWPPLGTAARRLLDAENEFRQGMNYLSEFRKMPGGAIMGRMQTLETLTSALIVDTRVARFEQEYIEKLQLCFSYEQAARNSVGHQLKPKEIIDEYAARLIKPKPPRMGASPGAKPWDLVRPALQVTIRSWVMQALFKYAMDPKTHGVNEFKNTCETLELARARWADVPAATRGHTLELTFLRQVKVLLGEALLLRYVNNESTLSRKEKHDILDEIISVANWILETKRKEPYPPASEKARSIGSYWNTYYQHYATPVARAYSLLGFAHLQLASLHPITITVDGPIEDADASIDPVAPTIHNTKHSTYAAIFYARSAAWHAADEPERLNALWYAIAAMIQRGGYFFSDFEILKDMAIKGTTYVSEFYGANCVPEQHLGKHLSRKHLGPTAAGEAGACMPLAAMKEANVNPANVEKYKEALWKYTEMVMEGHKEEWEGLLSLTAVIMNEWKLRTEPSTPGGEVEDMEKVGFLDVYKDIEDTLMEEWQAEVGQWVKGGEHRQEVMLGPGYSGEGIVG